MKHLAKLVIAFSAMLSIFANASQVALDVQVAVKSTENGNVDAVLTITNNSRNTQKVLSWYTDLTEEQIFTIKRDGEVVDYFGPHYKRHAPTEKDFIKLKSGQSITKHFELTAWYDMSAIGNYEVSFNVHSVNLFEHRNDHVKKGAQVQSLSSDAAFVYLDGVSSVKGDKTSNAKKGGGGSTCTTGTCFSGRCSNSQQSQILSALGAADQITNNAVAYLNAHSSNNVSARYNTWFGEATSSRYNTASAHFDAINDAIDNKPKTFDCSCKKSYFAYVYPNQPYKVYLCNAFWSAPEFGTDSRAGTIVHELSHFDIVAGTDDVVYGQTGAKNLAISNPDQALNNADSHEYFAENTPNQN
jgi:peptidyl-Lys metalloendopeptidase